MRVVCNIQAFTRRKSRRDRMARGSLASSSSSHSGSTHRVAVHIAFGSILEPVPVDRHIVRNSMVSAVRPGPNDIAQPLRPRVPARISASSTNITVADDMLP